MNRLYSNYEAAESDCDQIAGDNGFHMAVVERHDLEGPSEFRAVVLNITEAREMLEKYPDDAEIVYESDQTAETRARWY